MSEAPRSHESRDETEPRNELKQSQRNDRSKTEKCESDVLSIGCDIN